MKVDMDKRMEILKQLYNKRLYKKNNYRNDIRMQILNHIKNNYNIFI